MIQLSPLQNISKITAPLVITYSKSELNEFQRQSELFGEKWRRAGNACELIPYESLNHFEMLHEIRNFQTAYVQSFIQLIHDVIVDTNA